MTRSTVQEWTDAAIDLVKASHPDDIRCLERRTGCTQAEAVTHFIEHSCWAAELPDYSGGRRTAVERRVALLALWWAEVVCGSPSA